MAAGAVLPGAVLAAACGLAGQLNARVRTRQASDLGRSRGQGYGAVMMAARKPPGRQPRRQARKPAASGEKKKGLDPTLPSLLYYGCYTLFFGKMLLVIVERISGA